MRELALVGLSKDSSFVIARDAVSGEEFQIRADERLRSAATTDRVRLGQLEKPMESSLSPRDIQSRIRRGESPEAVADAAGVDVSRIRGYAIPVLAEREHICDRARSTVIRRRHISGASMALGGLVDEQLLTNGSSAESAAWDSWRREDGRWTLAITALGATDPATFVFDVQGRYVMPENDLARQLVGDVAAPDTADMAIADAIRSEAPVEATAEPQPHDGHPEGVSSLKAARDRRAMGQLALSDDIATDGSPVNKDSGGEQQENQDHDHSSHADMAVPDDVSPPSRKRRERRRVPSWDEIMFGGKNEG